MEKFFIRQLDINNLLEYFKSLNQPTYRAKQVYEWIWKKGVATIDEMSNIPKTLIEQLKNDFIWDKLFISTYQQSNDGTIKAAFKLYDNHFIEGVIIPSEKRITACISTQIGCPIKCAFCATGTLGFVRNLNVGEIYDQVLALNDLSIQKNGKQLTNIVIMGMGEPLLNYGNVLKAISYITSKDGLSWSPHRITLSTVGIPDKIEQIASDNPSIELAISLHTAIQQKREQLIPLAKKYHLDSILNSLKKYTKQTNQRVTIEYLMLDGINDTIEDAHALVRFASNFKSKINIIPYNKVEGLLFDSSKMDTIQEFIKILESKNIIVKLRKSRGNDIDAACGQLANKLKK